MSGFDMFQTSGYKNTRNRKKTLILDVSDEQAGDVYLGDGSDFNIKLSEPLIIDKHSEIYLDNFLTFNSNIGVTPSQSSYVLKINEFNINSSVASVTNNMNMMNSIIIPNEHKTVGNNHGAMSHKGKKFNYICDVNPQTITSISGRITDLSGSPIFHGRAQGNNRGQFTYTLTGISPANLLFGITDAQTFDFVRFFNAPRAAGAAQLPLGDDLSGSFIASHTSGALSLHFSTKREMTPAEKDAFSDRNAVGDIVFATGAFGVAYAPGAGLGARDANDVAIVINQLLPDLGFTINTPLPAPLQVLVNSGPVAPNYRPFRSMAESDMAGGIIGAALPAPAASQLNPNMTLISNPARFISEFSIVSRE